MTTKWCPASGGHADAPCAVCGWSPAEEMFTDLDELIASVGWCAPSTVEYEVKP